MLQNLLLRLSSPFRSIIRRELERREEAASKNIALELQRRALQSTVDYIERRMAGLDSVPFRFKLLKLALSKATKDGLFCEFGVFSGESINHIARQVKGRVYGFDSFEGLPERWIDGFRPGHFALAKLPKVPKNVELIKGWFHETLPKFIAGHSDQVSFLHIDCDLYSSTNTILHLLGPQIVPGTVIVFDEYFNYPGWQFGEFKAFQEFIARTKFSYEYISYNRYDEQVAVLIKARD
jgi:hypothetical protein